MRRVLLLGVLITTVVCVLYFTSFREGFAINSTRVQSDPVTIKDIQDTTLAMAVPNIDMALGTPLTKGVLRRGDPNGGNSTMQYPVNTDTDPSSYLQKAQKICEVVKTPDCNAFNRKDFAANCGISFDKKGTNSRGYSQMGGLYIESKVPVPANGIYVPSFGTSNKFAVNKETCEWMQNDIDCKSGKNSIGTKYCSLCYSDTTKHAIEASSKPTNLTFVLHTNATSLILNAAGVNYILLPQPKSKNIIVKPNSGSANGVRLTTITVPNVKIKESELVNIVGSHKDPDETVVIAGAVNGTTRSGKYTFDIDSIVDKDNGATPIVQGTFNKNKLFTQIYGNTNISLTGIMPFTFLATSSADTENCQNGPFISTAAGMNFISSDEPCYGSNQAPGTYGIPCLQKMFLSAGGTQKGKGYPKDATTAKALLFSPSKKPRTIDEIGQYLYETSVVAATGRAANGATVPQLTWNTASEFMTGVAITNPCQTRPGKALSAECLRYIYKQSGCNPNGTLNPSKKGPLPANVATDIKRGNYKAVDAFYKKIRATANNNTLPAKKRSQEIKWCYGTTEPFNRPLVATPSNKLPAPSNSPPVSSNRPPVPSNRSPGPSNRSPAPSNRPPVSPSNRSPFPSSNRPPSNRPPPKK